MLCLGSRVVSIDYYADEDVRSNSVDVKSRLLIITFLPMQSSDKEHFNIFNNNNNNIYIYIYIYIYIERERERDYNSIIVTVPLGGFVADQIWYNLESVQYL